MTLKPPDLNTSLNETSRLVKNTLTIDEPKDQNASNKSINLNENMLKIPLSRQISEFKHNKLPSQ